MTPRTLARTAGLLYLIVAVTGGFAELYVRSGALVRGDAAATAANIAASATLFRVGFAADLVNITCFLLAGLTLHTLLKPVDPRAALAMLATNAVAVAVMAANLINHLGALLAATSPDWTAAFGGGSADALAAMFLELHGHGYTIAQVFFGLWLLPLGYLIRQSGMFPRTLGVVVMVGCGGYLADVAATLFSPDYESSLSPILVWPAAIAEISLVLWLLLKGVRTGPVTLPAAPTTATPTTAAAATATPTTAAAAGATPAGATPTTTTATATPPHGTPADGTPTTAASNAPATVAAAR